MPSQWRILGAIQAPSRNPIHPFLVPGLTVVQGLERLRSTLLPAAYTQPSNSISPSGLADGHRPFGTRHLIQPPISFSDHAPMATAGLVLAGSMDKNGSLCETLSVSQENPDPGRTSRLLP